MLGSLTLTHLVWMDRYRQRFLFPVLAILLMLFVCAIVPIPWFQKVGYNRPSIRFSDMEATEDQGRLVRVLHLYRMTPDQAVRLSVYSPVVVVSLEVIGSDGSVLYQPQQMNFTFGPEDLIRPWHTSNVDVRITDLCSPCNYTGLEYVSYSEYSLFPAFEMLVVVCGSFVAAILIALADYLAVKHRPSTKRWRLWLIIIPVALASLAWYVYAFDIKDVPWYSLVLSSVGASIGVLAFILATPSEGTAQQIATVEESGEVVQEPTQVAPALHGWSGGDPAVVAQDWAAARLRPNVVQRWFDVEVSEDDRGRVVVRGGAVCEPSPTLPWNWHTFRVVMTKEGRILYNESAVRS
jgi:hypothetical protein